MSNFVTYQVELIEANAPLIDKLNTLLVPGYGSASETPSKSSKSDDTSSAKSTSKKITMSAVKKAVTAAKKAHGMDFINECIEDADGDIDETLAKNVSSIDSDEWPDFLAALDAGPDETENDDDLGNDNDDFGDDLDDDADDAESVKTACRAYAKEHGRDAVKVIMKKYKVGALSDVDNLSSAKLTKLMAAVA